MDVHQALAQVAILDDGKVVSEQRLDLVQDKVLAFGRSRRPVDEVVLEAIGNTAAIERLLRPFLARVVIANPRMVRAIAYARVKTDKIDDITLARLQASGFLPKVWAADEDTVRRRRQAVERMGMLEETARLKSRIHAILDATWYRNRKVLSSGLLVSAGWPRRCSLATNGLSSIASSTNFGIPSKSLFSIRNSPALLWPASVQCGL